MKLSLKQWRGMRGLTQAELAKQTEISQSKIACIESITQEEASKIREALTLKPSDSIISPFD